MALIEGIDSVALIEGTESVALIEGTESVALMSFSDLTFQSIDFDIIKITKKIRVFKSQRDVGKQFEKANCTPVYIKP